MSDAEKLMEVLVIIAVVLVTIIVGLALVAIYMKKKNEKEETLKEDNSNNINSNNGSSNNSGKKTRYLTDAEKDIYRSVLGDYVNEDDLAKRTRSID